VNSSSLYTCAIPVSKQTEPSAGGVTCKNTKGHDDIEAED
jgi:hypothetical protein